MNVLIEAEAFADLGGWLVDQQSMDLIGSPYLLAHGLGRPVAPARTVIALPHAGIWRLWVRTRDWAAPHGPGAFRVHLDGVPHPRVFGCDGDGAWAWHDGGSVACGRSVELALEDLTGFDGRCDCLLFSDENGPPAEPSVVRPPRPIEQRGPFDLVVAGGGYAGICAAVTAARHGLRVALINDRPVLGGMASAEVRVGPIGGLDTCRFPANAEVVRELSAGATSSGGQRDGSNDEQVLALVRAEPGIELHLDTHVTAVERDGDRIVALYAEHTRHGARLRFAGALFADCTGDAAVGVLAGASWRSGREGRDQTGEELAPAHADDLRLGNTNFWHAERTGTPQSFPACPWALPIRDETDFEVSPPKWPVRLDGRAYVGGWNWESGFDRDAATEAETIRDHNLRAIYGVWDWLKNRSPRRPEFADARLAWIGHILGKRESRRLLGDLVLTQQDIVEGRVHPDGCVTATWYFDLHFPHPDSTRAFPGREFRSLAYDDPDFERLRGTITGGYTTIRPYEIPFRCFYSRNLANLFMAGRDISVTHVALAPVRTQKTTGMMGTVVGRAACLCRRLGVGPRELYRDHLDKLLQALADPASPDLSPGSTPG